LPRTFGGAPLATRGIERRTASARVSAALDTFELPDGIGPCNKQTDEYTEPNGDANLPALKLFHAGNGGEIVFSRTIGLATAREEVIFVLM
jgi:hypothetical protein